MENIGWGLQMTVLGMGLVFSLLALLWVLLIVVLKLDKDDSEEELPETDLDVAEDAPIAVVPANVEGISGELVAAITLAVAKFKFQRVPADVAAAITIAAVEHRKAIGPWRPAVARTFWPGTQPSRWTTAGRARARFRA